MHPHSRTFIRHPIDIPIEVAAQSGPEHAESLRNLSFGGLAFSAERSYEPGTLLGIKIQAPTYPVQLAARVAWCKPNPEREDGNHYEIGVAFEDSVDAFRIRMVEQVCQIERYRLSVLGREGREMTADEAAQEWIEQHAEHFYPQA